MTSMMCPNCGKRPASKCGYLDVIDGLNGVDYDCQFPWEDTPYIDAPLCEDCPLVWCSKCKENAIISASLFINMFKELKDESC